MLKLDHKAKFLLLVAASVLASTSPVLALDEAKPSKPLNLLSFARARASGPQKPQPVTAMPGDNASIRATAWAAEDSGPATTGAVPETPAPAAAPAPTPARPAKPASVTVPPKPAPPQAAVPADNEVALFCSNVADPAVDARLAWQLKELEKAESLLRERIAEVEAKRAEYERWMALRDDFLKKAEASVVEIYSRMKPTPRRPRLPAWRTRPPPPCLPSSARGVRARSSTRWRRRARRISPTCWAECAAWMTERPNR